jgi:hypothetical protein
MNAFVEHKATICNIYIVRVLKYFLNVLEQMKDWGFKFDFDIYGKSSFTEMFTLSIPRGFKEKYNLHLHISVVTYT